MTARTRITRGIVAGLASLALGLPAAAAADPVSLDTFGSEGPGAGQLQNPTSVLVAPSGNLYVADTGNYRISVHGPTGGFIHAFGIDVIPGDFNGFEVCTTGTTCQASSPDSAAGGFVTASGMALAPDGRLYVADLNTNRINVFDVSGNPTFVHAFGIGVDGGSALETCTITSICEDGLFTDAAGGLKNPSGLALDGAGNLYIADTNNHRISVFNPSGPSFIRAFGFGVATNTNQFETCTASCQAGDGVTADITVPGEDAAAGALTFPYGIALDASGDLYVAEGALKRRLSVIDTEGPSFVRAFGIDVDPAGGSVFEPCTATCQRGSGTAGPGGVFEPKGLAFDGSGALHVSDQFFHRVNTYAPAAPTFTHAFGWDVVPGGSTGLFEVCTTSCDTGVQGAGVGQLSSPSGVAADCKGGIWVAEVGGNRVQRFGEPDTPLPPCVTATPTNGDSPTGNPSGGTTKKKCKKKKKAKRGASAAKKKCKKKKRK